MVELLLHLLLLSSSDGGYSCCSSGKAGTECLTSAVGEAAERGYADLKCHFLNFWRIVIKPFVLLEPLLHEGVHLLER